MFDILQLPIPGKTTASRAVLRRLRQEDKIAGVIDLDLAMTSRDENFDLINYAKMQLGVPELRCNSMKDFAELVRATKDKPLVVFVDHVDNLQPFPTKFLSSLRGLGNLSASEKSFVTLVGVRSEENFKILNALNEGQKIKPVSISRPFIWTKDELKAVISKFEQCGYKLDPEVATNSVANSTNIGTLLDKIDPHFQR